jgi:hypothetical protein
LRRFERDCREPAENEHATGKAGLSSGGPVARPVADGPGCAQLERHSSSRREEHSVCGLAGRGAGRRSHFWVIRASEQRVDKGASGRQLPKDALLHCREVQPAEQPAADAGLVGDNVEGYAGTIGGAN